MNVLNNIGYLLALLILIVSGCSLTKYGSPIDSNATAETVNLYRNLAKLSRRHTLFGHQHATEYGHGWSGDEDRSDVKSVIGSHPAVIGVDFSGFSGRSPEAIKEAKDKLRKNVSETYDRGGVTTVAWHFSNPLSGGGFYWKDSVSVPAVRHMIPGGDAHDIYKEILDGIGEWAKSVRGSDGKLVPMIFRPYHEFDGDWFWWGKSHTTREEFISMWEFTISYLRDTLGVHNFIYAFSPDNRYVTEEEYLERYPGDQWVDMVGMDNYADMGRDGRYSLDTAALKLKIISDYARKNKKLAAFTETGLESVIDQNWYTESLLPTLKNNRVRIAYVLVWRNDQRSPTHYYAPYPGHPSVPDFMKFYRDPYTLFERNIKGIYNRRVNVK